jgi:hypothetical protein
MTVFDDDVIPDEDDDNIDDANDANVLKIMVRSVGVVVEM